MFTALGAAAGRAGQHGGAGTSMHAGLAQCGASPQQQLTLVQLRDAVLSVVKADANCLELLHRQQAHERQATLQHPGIYLRSRSAVAVAVAAADVSAISGPCVLRLAGPSSCGRCCLLAGECSIAVAPRVPSPPRWRRGSRSHRALLLQPRHAAAVADLPDLRLAQPSSQVGQHCLLAPVRRDRGRLTAQHGGSAAGGDQMDPLQHEATARAPGGCVYLFL